MAGSANPHPAKALGSLFAAEVTPAGTAIATPGSCYVLPKQDENMQPRQTAYQRSSARQWHAYRSHVSPLQRGLTWRHSSRRSRPPCRGALARRTCSSGAFPWGVATIDLKTPECGHHTLFLSQYL